MRLNKPLATSLLLLGFACFSQAEPLSFIQAQERLLSVSDALHSAGAKYDAQQELAKATRSLHGPEISLDVQHMRFSKSVDLKAIKPYQPLFPHFNVPDEFSMTQWRTRPIVTASLPLYMGGKISAAKAAADAGSEVAQAELYQTQQDEVMQLAQAYFSQLLAQQAWQVRQHVYQGLQQHYDHASRLEREGFVTQAQKLQAKVALDNAEREQRKAESDYQAAQAALSRLLRSEQPIVASSYLFVSKQALPDVEMFLTAATQDHPGLEKIRALIQQSKQKVTAEKAEYLPHFYLFGQYDLKREDAFITEPDWAFGVGMKYALLSNKNRNRQLKAAKNQQQQAEYSLQDHTVQLLIGVERAWLAADNARTQYQLLASASASADENLRLQTLSFQEGQATSLDVIDARLQQAKVHIEQAQAAWQFDMALIQLLNLSGQTQQFASYMEQAEKVAIYE